YQAILRWEGTEFMLRTNSAGWKLIGLSGLVVSALLMGCSNGNKTSSAASPTLFVTDGVSHRVVRINDINTPTWTALGTLGSGTNQFNRPSSVFLDTGNHLLITDMNNNRIVRTDDITGANWTTLGTAGSGTGQFSLPKQAVVDSTGHIFVVDS